jgi:hypothetical protein
VAANRRSRLIRAREPAFQLSLLERLEGARLEAFLRVLQSRSMREMEPLRPMAPRWAVSLRGLFPHRVAFHGLKSNYVLVEGTTPGVSLLSIRSDPFVLYLSYSQVSALEYTLEDDAEVTVTIRNPSGTVVRTLLSGESQSAGEHEVIWDGTNNLGRPVAEEGDFTFTVTATHAVSGSSTTRKGNIVVRK